MGAGIVLENASLRTVEAGQALVAAILRKDPRDNRLIHQSRDTERSDNDWANHRVGHGMVPWRELLSALSSYRVLWIGRA